MWGHDATTQGGEPIHLIYRFRASPRAVLGRRLAYAYRYKHDGRTARLHLESNAPGTGALRLRLPDGTSPEWALLDGTDVKFTVETVGRDADLALTTAWGTHGLEVRLR